MFRFSYVAAVVTAGLFGFVMTAPSQVEAYFGAYKLVSDDSASCLYGKQGCGYWTDTAQWAQCSEDLVTDTCGYLVQYFAPVPTMTGDLDANPPQRPCTDCAAKAWLVAFATEAPCGDGS